MAAIMPTTIPLNSPDSISGTIASIAPSLIPTGKKNSSPTTFPNAIIASMASHMFQLGPTIAQLTTPTIAPIATLAAKSPTAKNKRWSKVHLSFALGLTHALSRTLVWANRHQTTQERQRIPSGRSVNSNRPSEPPVGLGITRN